MSDSRFPLIEKLGLCVYETWVGQIFPDSHVSAIELESYLKRAIKVYLHPATDDWCYKKEDGSTHSGILIAVKELPKKPIKVEQTFAATFAPDEIFKPLELTGKKFKVTFEEIVE